MPVVGVWRMYVLELMRNGEDQFCCCPYFAPHCFSYALSYPQVEGTDEKWPSPAASVVSLQLAVAVMSKVTLKLRNS